MFKTSLFYSFFSWFSRVSLDIWLISSPLLGILFLLRRPKLLQWRNKNHSAALLFWMAQCLILRESFFIKTTPWSVCCNGVTVLDSYPSSSLGVFLLRGVFFFSFFYYVPILLPPTEHCTVLLREDLLPLRVIYTQPFCWIVFSQCCIFSVLLCDTGLSI